MFVIVLIALSPIVVFIPHLSRYFSLAEESFKVFTVRCIPCILTVSVLISIHVPKPGDGGEGAECPLSDLGSPEL